MDPRQFDALSRALANGVSRRQALARLGAGGLAAGLAAAVGRGRSEAARPTAQADTCRLEIVANVRLGPSAGALLQGTVPGELRGELSFALGSDGAIDRGRWRLGDDTELPVVGHAAGRAISLRAEAGDGLVVVLVGTAEEGLDRCAGAVDGLLTGPQVGDLGDWHATATALGGRGTTGGGAPAAVALPTRAARPASPPAATADATAEPTTTATVTPTETATPEPTATSEPTASPAPTPTPTPEPLILCAAPLVDCGGVCVDLSSDAANCGSCGNVCGVIEVCQAGECGGAVLDPGGTFACAAGLVDCGGACVDVLTDPANCGACGVVCAADEICFRGLCARDHRD